MLRLSFAVHMNIRPSAKNRNLESASGGRIVLASGKMEHR